MVELFKFIFSSFWVWLGTVILIVAASEFLKGIFSIVIDNSKSNKE